jgi:hypothetical protein
MVVEAAVLEGEQIGGIAVTLRAATPSESSTSSAAVTHSHDQSATSLSNAAAEFDPHWR